MSARRMLIALLALAFGAVASAGEQSGYAPGKVVYDFSHPDTQELKNILDRASVLQNIYGNNPFESSIVIVVHEAAIPLFARRNQDGHADLMRRAAGLAMGEVIEFRLCRMSARMQGLGDGDFQEFVTMIPMADAELVRLQRSGYAYLN